MSKTSTVSDKHAKAVVRAALRLCMDKFKLDDWTLDLTFTDLEEDIVGQCKLRPEYCQADITLDLTKINTDLLLVATVRHELLHVTLAHYHSACKVALRLSASSPVREGINEVMWQAGERSVFQLEYLCDGLGFSDEDLLAEVRQVLKKGKAA